MITGRVSLSLLFGLPHRVEPDYWQSEGQEHKSCQIYIIGIEPKSIFECEGLIPSFTYYPARGAILHSSGISRGRRPVFPRLVVPFTFKIPCCVQNGRPFRTTSRTCSEGFLLAYSGAGQHVVAICLHHSLAFWKSFSQGEVSMFLHSLGQ
jgi:hypothetical protein